MQAVKSRSAEAPITAADIEIWARVERALAGRRPAYVRRGNARAAG